MKCVSGSSSPRVLRLAKFRVEVQQVTVEAQVDRVLFAELSQVAHLRATATLSKGGPLLAGPVRIVRGRSLVGRGRVDYVGKGEPFELGLAQSCRDRVGDGALAD